MKVILIILLSFLLSSCSLGYKIGDPAYSLARTDPVAFNKEKIAKSKTKQWKNQETVLGYMIVLSMLILVN